MNAMHRNASFKSFFALKTAILAAVAVLLTSPGGARAETWCLRDFGSDRQTCVFSSAGQCTSAAVVAGGICERERWGRAAASKPNTAKPCTPRAAHSARRSRAAGSAACDAS